MKNFGITCIFDFFLFSEILLNLRFEAKVLDYIQPKSIVRSFNGRIKLM